MPMLPGLDTPAPRRARRAEPPAPTEALKEKALAVNRRLLSLIHI